jgi:hypothetical protein
MELPQKEDFPNPTEAEVRNWLLSTTRHSIRMEFCLEALGLGSRDPERPHDIVGPGNKFDWPVLRGLAIEDRHGISRDIIVVPSLTIHRGQFHHLKWNDEHSGASEDEMMLGATDAICSLLENRLYQGGTHSADEIRMIIETRNPPYRRPWMTKALDQVLGLNMPDLNQIQSLDRIPNPGLPPSNHETIVQRVRETITMLKQGHGYTMPNS